MADITEGLRPPTDFLVDLFENGAVALHLVGPDGTIRYANRAELQLLGYDPDEYIGRDIAQFHADPDTIADILTRLSSGETLDKYPARLRAKDGSIRHVLISSSVFFDEHGDFRNTRCFTVDVTEKVKAEEALREAQQRLSATYEIALTGIAEADAEGRILRANESLSRLTGYSKEELLLRSIFAMTHPDDIEPDRRQYERQVRGEIDQYQTVKRYVRADGAVIWVHVMSTAVRKLDGTFHYGVRVAHDVSDQKLAEDRTRLLINELNHRVKNTLTTVQSLARQTSRSTCDIGDFMNRFEGRLLALSKAHDRLTRRNWEGASLSEIVSEEIAVHRDEARGLSCSGPDVSLSPRAALSLSMCLHELGTNATKYGALTSVSGRVEVSWRVDRDSYGRPTRVHLEWVERDGPLVKTPTSRGFGSRLLEALAVEIGGEAHLSFGSNGLEWRIAFPVANEEDVPSEGAGDLTLEGAELDR